MRILFYLYQYPAIGGIEAVTAVLARGFSEEGHSVFILSHVGKPQEFSVLSCAADIQQYKMPEECFFSVRNRDYLQRLLVDLRIDMVIFQDSYAPIERNLFVKGLQFPVVVCEHNAPYSPEGSYKAKYPFLLEMVRRSRLQWLSFRRRREDSLRKRFLYDQCWRYVLLTDRYLGEFKVITRLPDFRKLRAIGNPLTVSVPKVLPAKNNEIVFVGTVEHRKGSDFLPEIFQTVGRRYPDWKFKVVGDGPGMEELRRRVSGLQNVELLGYQSDPSKYFKGAKIFVFPTRREGWPLVTVEAQACGCVPVLFDSFSAARDIIQDGKNGILVSSFDVEEFGERLCAIIEDGSKFLEMSKAAMLSVQDFDVNKILQKWLQLFRELNGVK